jgi:APA family basic amino acid/polyamine antiporter
MALKDVLRRKSIETLLAEMAGEHSLARVLGPTALTALGVGAIIGAGIFVMTGRVAAVDAGPAILISFTVAALGCALAALCYSEFAAMAPVAGSAYTYAYATLGEVFAWIIGWDLMLEYAMSCATVASAWSHYLNAFLVAFTPYFMKEPHQISELLVNDPFSTSGAYGNLPGALVMLAITVVLVRGIRESALTNAILVLVKLAVVVLVIVLGAFYIQQDNWTSIPVYERLTPEESAIPKLADSLVAKEVEESRLAKIDQQDRVALLEKQALASYKIDWVKQADDRLVEAGEMTAADAARRWDETLARHSANLPKTPADQAEVAEVLTEVREKTPEMAAEKWGMLGVLGLNHLLIPIDEATRSPFMPYGLSGVMLGAALVFFAYIGFDSISTHAEEAKNPQRDVPFAILTSLALCTVLYIAVAAVITGMVPYPEIDQKAAVATAFGDLAIKENSHGLRFATSLIAAGGLAGMTSVLLVTFLSQVRVFMAMARDGLLPPIFSHVHPKFHTPHLATMLTGGVICVVAAFTPIRMLEEMVNIGTLMAFVVVCAAVLLLRIRSPEVKRPFRCPVIYVVAPLGILVNLTLMLFLPVDTWIRLVVWLGIGMAIYFAYSRFHSKLNANPNGHTIHELKKQGLSPTDAPLL